VERRKRARQGSASALVGEREGEGAPAGEAAAINGREGLRPSMHSRGRCDGRRNGWELRRERSEAGLQLPLDGAQLGRGESGELSAAALDAEQGTRLEVRDGPDVWGRVGSERRGKGRGLTHGPGLAASEKEERGGAAGPAKERRLGCWAARERKGGGPRVGFGVR
jgi:hypothetical protein